ncbi:tRNA (adenosine(37)-N6)-threonylcarbamoyltransferase complex dimerization subunit type 1 TsaB [Novipirellula aureliae]|uniref:tRNA (adenosine(37)-N6)-threonylcarbamoyltransferase complex dimerization subunit type 1 TsaB n=1 Tax=Novipirellula aureliae TaxID=2527966 RepID=UPI0018CED068|nr:tRNA (adenosine(37)-N6)-threonylcarbamoyltransferase complex dimerization subunit type 1 TsaB [Novipirellula aureliae]
MPHPISPSEANPFGTQLAIETTGRVGSVAVLSGGMVVFEQQIGEPSDKQTRTASEIGPVLQAALACCHEQAEPLAFVSVADGPGSFTGLRIGVTSAKMLSYALQVPLVAVNSLAAIAANVFDQQQKRMEDGGTLATTLLVACDAYRGQVFCATFEKSLLMPAVEWVHPSWSPLCEQVEILESEAWDSQLARVGATVDGVAGDEKPFRKYPIRPIERVQADAVGVGILGVRAAMISRWTDPFALVPRYLKPSAAEEKAAASLKPE